MLPRPPHVPPAAPLRAPSRPRCAARSNRPSSNPVASVLNWLMRSERGGVESVVDVTDGDGIVADCMMTGLRRPRAVRLRMLGRVGDYRPSGDRRPRARTILVEVEPTVEERLARIREVAHRSLRYYATAFLNTDVAEEHVIAERDLLMAYMTDLANVMALLDDNELDDRAMLAARHEVLQPYIEAAGEDPSTPYYTWRLVAQRLGELCSQARPRLRMPGRAPPPSTRRRCSYSSRCDRFLPGKKSAATGAPTASVMW